MAHSKNNQVRTRFAPSPTGFLHIGGLRTALYTFLFAKQNNGRFVLRLEDTDIKRQVEGAAEKIYDGLKWAGLQYDEGPDIGGPYEPYVQSQRLEIYKKHAEQLLAEGHAYRCFCSDETLEQMRQEQIAKKQPPKYDRRCLKLSKSTIVDLLNNNKSHVIRMKIPENRAIEFTDIVRGKVVYKSEELDDQVLLKSDGYPTYHLAVVVDDHLMEISHVTRTEEWLPSTPKHILLYEYLGWQPPQWAHLPLLLNPDKTKMSKRAGDVALEDYIRKGYLPQAMINYLAFLGWNPGTPASAKATAGKEKEIYSLAELLKDFDLNKVHKAGAVFNVEKLNWYNAYYIKQTPLDKLTEMCIPYLMEAGLLEVQSSPPAGDLPKGEKFSPCGGSPEGRKVQNDNAKFKIKKTGEFIDFNWIKKIVALEQERMDYLSQIGENVEFFFETPAYDKELLCWREMTNEEIKKSLETSKKIISEISDEEFNKEEISSRLLSEAEIMKNRGELLWPLRVALAGQKNSPPPFDVAEILGKKESLARIEKAISLLT